MTERLMVYVDGFNLYHGLHDTYRHRFLWLDVAALARALRPTSQLVSVKYFTASVLNDPAAQGRQDVYIDALKAANPSVLEVTMGRYQQKQRSCRKCGATWRTYEEKETDVNIAVTIAADATAGHADTFMLISGDSDMAPAVRLAMKLNPKARFVAAFPPARFSAELQALMPSSFHIGRARIAGALLPDRVPLTGTSKVFVRPPKWT